MGVSHRRDRRGAVCARGCHAKLTETGITVCTFLRDGSQRRDLNQTTVRVYAPFLPSRERQRPVLNPALALGARIIGNTGCNLHPCGLSGA